MSGLSPWAFLPGRIDFFPLATAKRSGLPRGLPFQLLQPFLELLKFARTTIASFQRLTELLPQLPILLLELGNRHRGLKFIVGHVKPYAC